MEDGIILKIISETGGIAQLDLDGDGNEDNSSSGNATLYDELGITVDERIKLSELYHPGLELWRARLDHFTPADLNLGPSPGEECAPGDPDCPLPNPFSAASEEGSCTVRGSIIECQNQTVGQRMPITGTPYALHYQSDRAPGYQAAYQVVVPLAGYPPPPAGTDSILVEIQVAGQRHRALAAVCPCDEL